MQRHCRHGLMVALALLLTHTGHRGFTEWPCLTSIFDPKLTMNCRDVHFGRHPTIDIALVPAVCHCGSTSDRMGEAGGKEKE